MLERAGARRARVGRGLRAPADPAAPRRAGPARPEDRPGLLPYPRPDDGFEQKETVLLETRDELAILWLNRPPANPISPQVIRDLTALWDEIERATRSARS